VSEINLEIVTPKPADGARLLELARKIDLFVPEDFDVIEELWTDFATNENGASHYHFIVAKQADDFLGFACYGQRPLTKGTFDLYWIVVAQDQQGHGIGKALIHTVEERVRTGGGRLLIAETEGKPSYEPTRHFYLAAGYELEACIRDFYWVGNDLVIFTKRL